jgi:hypothetical protein
MYDSPTNFVDPLGLWTISLGGTVNLSWGFFNYQYSGGLVVDDQGNVGVYNTLTPFPGGSLGTAEWSMWATRGIRLLPAWSATWIDGRRPKQRTAL